MSGAQPRRGLRRGIAAGAILLAVLAAGGSGAWWLAVRKMQAALLAWEDAQRARGWTIAHADPRPGGWPLAAALVLPDVALSGTGLPVPGGVAWTAARLTLRVGLTDAGQAVAQVDGAQTLRVGTGAPLGYAAARFALAVTLSNPAGPVTLEAEDLRFDSGGAVALLHAEAARVEAGVSVQFAAQSLDLPPALAPATGLGGRIASATGEAALTGALPDKPVSPLDAARLWRQSQGSVVLRRFAMGWGPLGVSGTATLALDAGLQPTGSAKLRAVGYAQTLSALSGAHVIAPDAARAARAVLSLLATDPGDGGAPVVDVTVDLRDRTLSAGHFPLVRLPELVWPGAPGSASVAP